MGHKTDRNGTCGKCRKTGPAKAAAGPSLLEELSPIGNTRGILTLTPVAASGRAAPQWLIVELPPIPA
jgi:hypothetical protein